MASSGTFRGSRTVSTGPQLELYWRQLSQDIPNNRTRIRLELRVYSQYNIYFSASKSGQLEGTNFTYSNGMSGSGRRTVYTKDIWVSHNSDGRKSVNFSGYLNIKVSWSTGYVSQIKVSGTATLNTIPRASSLNSFGIGYALQPDHSNRVDLRISRHSSSFRHSIYLKHGSTTIASWGGQSLPTSLTISSGQVNNLIKRMKSSTTATLTLVVQTKSGSSNIGSSVSRKATATLHSSVIPNISGFTIGIAGSSHDKTIGKYVQNVSKVTASFSGSPVGWAYLKSERIYIRKTDGSHSQTIHADSGTSGVVRGIGTFEAVAEVVDSRNRKRTQKKTFTVNAYSSPHITTFSADRLSGTPTNVSIKRYGNHSDLDGNNSLTIIVSKKQTTATSWDEVSNVTTPNGSFGTALTSTGNDVTKSYEFRVVAEDQFKKKAEATVTVSTDKVVLSINKNDGVGVGKIHEKGALDVLGKSYFDGHARFMENLYTDGLAEFNSIAYFNSSAVFSNGVRVNYALTSDQNDIPEGITLMQTGSSDTQDYPETYASILNVKYNVNRMFQVLSKHDSNRFLWRTHHVNFGWGEWKDLAPRRGSNSNGDYVLFGDGVLICWKRLGLDLTTGRYSEHTWVFPHSFISSPNVFATRDGYASGQNHNGATIGVYDSSDRVRLRYFSGTTDDISGRRGIRVMAIGRWK